MDCIFCKIAAGEIDSQKVYEDDLVVAFRDINPAAPAHILVVPREHVARASDLREDQCGLAGHLLISAGRIAEQQGLKDYRLVLNCGPSAGQSVFHLHLHLLGGRALSWPPG